MKRTHRWIVAASGLLLLVAACADDDAAPEPEVTDPTEDDGDDAEEGAAEEEAATDAAAEDDTTDEPAADGAATVALATTDLGEVLVDGEGMTLYLFDMDEQGGESTCYDDCAGNWPPLVTDGDPVAGDGADDALLGTVERDDGETQVTYDGWPLYHFIADQAPGDVAGQAVQDVWWVLDASGAPIREAGADEEAADEETEDRSY